MADLTPYLWIVRLVTFVGGFILVNQAARGLATVLRRDAAGAQDQRSPTEQLGLAGLRYLATCLCFAAVFTATGHGDSWLSWLLRVAMTAPYLTLLVALLVAFLALVHLISNRLQRQSRHYGRTHAGTRRTHPGEWYGPAFNPATGLPMLGMLDAAGNAYGTGDNSMHDGWHPHSDVPRDDDYSGTTAWHNFDDQRSTTFEPTFDSTIHGSDTDSWRGSDRFDHDFSSGDSMTSSTSHSSHDDWSNAWGTAADFQIPAESNFDDPTHDFTSTTYGNDSWDHDSSFSSSSWD